MKLSITHQSSYSRGQLLLRTFFGWLYIVIPNMFLFVFIGIWADILTFIAWWVVLFTGKYPKSFFEFMVKLINWGMRVEAAFANLVDGTPAIGINGTSDKVSVIIPYPEKSSRGKLLLRTIFGAFYIGIPHVFCLIFRQIASSFLMFIAWWVVLITGKYPEQMHSFNVGTYRWSLRVGIYMSFMTDDYPPFTGK